MAADYKFVHTSLIPIRWGDMDAFGHVNNAVYFSYMEQTRVEFMTRLGFMRPRESVFVIVNAGCTFSYPLVCPGMVEIRMYTGEPGRSSIETSYEFRLRGDDKLYANGHAKIVWLDAATGRSAPLPDELRDALALISGQGRRD